MGNRYSIYPCVITTSGPTTTNFRQIQNVNVNPGSNKAEITPGGSLDRSAVILATADPTVTFDTADLSTALGIISPIIGVPTISPGGEWQFQKRADQGAFASGSSHVTANSTQGFIYPTSLSASQDDSSGAVLSLTYVALWDGTNNPLTVSASQALTSTPAFIGQYFLGPVYVNSVLLPTVMSTTIDFGIDFRVFRSGGEHYGRVGSIVARNPTFSITVAALDELTSSGLFVSSAAGSVEVYYRLGSAGGTRIADITTSHLSIAAATSETSPDSISVSGNEDGSTTITFRPTASLTVNTGTAIP